MRYFLTLLSFLILNIASAQDTKENKHGIIAGKVIDSLSNGAIEYATISLFAGDNKKPVNGTTTNAQGIFQLEGLKTGTYSIVIESIGYASRKMNQVVFNRNSSLDIGTIRLHKSRQELESVTVTAPKGLIENKIDKIVFNAEKDLTSQGGVATDLLKKIPQISVDVDGNVELAGSTSIKFLINGKPSTAFGNNITDVLQSIPASQIKSIEVITNPGAKYDAEGLGGIINIILKSSKANGINGSVSLTAGTRIENGSVNFNARHGNFGVNAFVNGNYRLRSTMPSNSTRISTDTGSKTNVVLEQDGQSSFIRHGYQAGMGFDWTYKKKNNFTGSLTYSNFGFSSNGMIDQTQTEKEAGSAGNILSEITTTNPSTNSFAFHSIDFSIGYKRNFNKEDQVLEFQANTSLGNNTIQGSSYQLMQPQDSLFFGTTSYNPGTEKETQIQLDYTQPFGKDIHFGVGGKLTVRDITSNSVVNSFQPDANDYVYDSALSNWLTYDMKVYAGYAELSMPVGKLFEMKVGGRYERTEINSYFSNATSQVPVPGYNTFVPSIFFSKRINDNQTIKLSYSKRINRPDYRELNPFINTTDPKNVTAGNPYLQPEIQHRVEFSYSRDFNQAGSAMITLFYRSSNDDIQPYIVYYPSLKIGDTVYTNIAVSTSRNIGLEENMGMSFFGDIHPGSKWGIRTNFMMFARHTTNIIDTGYNSSSFNYRINLNLSYQISSTFSAELFGNFNSPRNELQGKYPSFSSYSLGLRKQIWNKKGSIALTATNPFNEYVNQETTLYGPNFVVNGLRKVPFRSIGINFTWKFGKLQFKKERENNGDTNGAPEGAQ
jgi:outer membrane receptor protein involved in Fe transport